MPLFIATKLSSTDMFSLMPRLILLFTINFIYQNSFRTSFQRWILLPERHSFWFLISLLLPSFVCLVIVLSPWCRMFWVYELFYVVLNCSNPCSRIHKETNGITSNLKRGMRSLEVGARKTCSSSSSRNVHKSLESKLTHAMGMSVRFQLV